MKKLKLALRYWTRKIRRSKSKDKPSFNIDSIHKIDGGGKGADIWGTDWPIPVAEKLEWSFCTTCYDQKQYVITKLTDYILWLIPFSYDEYVYEVPNGTYDENTINNKDIVEAIALCEKWNWHTDKLYNDTDSYNAVGIIHMKDRWILPLGNNDYQFIRTK